MIITQIQGWYCVSISLENRAQRAEQWQKVRLWFPLFLIRSLPGRPHTAWPLVAWFHRCPPGKLPNGCPDGFPHLGFPGSDPCLMWGKPPINSFTDWFFPPRSIHRLDPFSRDFLSCVTLLLEPHVYTKQWIVKSFATIYNHMFPCDVRRRLRLCSSLWHCH